MITPFFLVEWFGKGFAFHILDILILLYLTQFNEIKEFVFESKTIIIDMAHQWYSYFFGWFIESQIQGLYWEKKIEKKIKNYFLRMSSLHF